MCNRLDIITLLRVSEYTEDTARPFMFLNVYRGHYEIENQNDIYVGIGCKTISEWRW